MTLIIRRYLPSAYFEKRFINLDYSFAPKKQLDIDIGLTLATSTPSDIGSTGWRSSLLLFCLFGSSTLRVFLDCYVNTHILYNTLHEHWHRINLQYKSARETCH